GAASSTKPPPPSTTAEFFNDIDQNGDGKLEASEIRGWVEDTGTADPDEVMETAMEHLDRDEDQAVTLGDMKAWFGRLGSVLTVAEAADWVVHAVQLPPEVGEAFRSNMVSGYDFPDLIKEDGKALHYDLGVTRRSFRKRIMKAIELRLLGLGSMPEAPSATGVALGPRASAEWCTVYSGVGGAHIDHDAGPGRSNTYRIQAWNVIGHSDYEYVTVETPP
ncbi:unnamed protein product, partial [Phaeothamnion confervicola]